jgi:hypothetical protein
MDNLDQQLYENRNISAFTNIEKKRKKNFDPKGNNNSPFSPKKIHSSLILNKDLSSTKSK